MTPSSFAFNFALSFALSLLGAFLWLKVWQWRALRRQKRRLKRGLAVEAEGEVLLKQQGFELKALQTSIEVAMAVDGRHFTYEIRPDALAVRGGRLFAVEMKTGAVATNPLFKETRRQLLEYYYALPVDGVVLVDIERKKISEISFISKRPSHPIELETVPARRSIFWPLLLLLAILYLLYLYSPLKNRLF